MQPERPRAHRYSFLATVELTDLQSETQMKEQTSDLSLFGCHVNTSKPWPAGTRVRIRITHRGAIFAAFGRVAYVQPNVGMGISFTSIEGNEDLTLEKWIAELREQ
jgi:PilZ domain-containing protein